MKGRKPSSVTEKRYVPASSREGSSRLKFPPASVKDLPTTADFALKDVARLARDKEPRLRRSQRLSREPPAGAGGVRLAVRAVTRTLLGVEIRAVRIYADDDDFDTLPPLLHPLTVYDGDQFDL